jgi:hypothetical protein
MMPGLVVASGGSLQFWKYGRYNCAACAFLTLVEVLLSANRISWDPGCMLGTVLAGRAVMKNGSVSQLHRTRTNMSSYYFLIRLIYADMAKCGCVDILYPLQYIHAPRM